MAYDPEAPVKKGPADKEWARSYRDIGTRISNWKQYENSKEHFQCYDCGYYWPTEIDTEEHMYRCWHCWMRVAYPDELRRTMMYARNLGKPEAKQEQTQEPQFRAKEKVQAKAVTRTLGFEQDNKFRK